MAAQDSMRDVSLPEPRGAVESSTRPRRNPWSVRIYRLARASLHLARGLATVGFVFPFIAPQRRKQLIGRWSVRLLEHFHVELRVCGALPQDRSGALLVVANHVSWLDIFVLNTLEPARFVAKAELRHWPVVGALISGVGTLYIDRAHRRHTHEIASVAKDALLSGDVVAIFPEGAVTDGRDMRPFHGSLLQPVIDMQGILLPVALRYEVPPGEAVSPAAYVGNFLQSAWRIAGETAICVDMTVSAPLLAMHRHRRELALDAERAIRSALGLPPRSPETKHVRRAP